ncbi:MAG: Maf family protein [Sphingomicrobium sp.]
MVLASGSAIRLAMLTAAGVTVTVDPADIDEGAVKRLHSGDDASLALALAEAKALETSRRSSQSWVIGGDSLVSVDGHRFDKPTDRDEAADHLRRFSGKVIKLTSGVALARGGAVDWSLAEVASLQVRLLSDEFINTYLEAEWPAVSYCVGVFRMEGRGVTLFDRVEGDHFTILGMPLLPLLGALRERGLVAA